MESTPKGRPSEADADSSSPSSALDVRFKALRAIAELRHPHLAAMRSAPSGPGFEVEPPAGISLGELSDGGEAALDLRMRIRILLDALSGLAALHRAKLDGKPIGFVHGEVAPHNIVVARDGVGRLVPLVESHWSNPPVPASASLGYVAPERLLGDVFDQRADVFSIGVLLWEAIAGRRLFANVRMDAIVTQLVGGKVGRPPSVPDAPWADALTDVAMQALAVDPADRWPHVGVMGAEIETIAEGALASSDEIALLLRQRSGERPSYEPMGDRPTYEPTGAERQRYGSVMPAAPPAPADLARGSVQPDVDPPPERSSVVPGSMPRAAAPGGLIVWHGPQNTRPTARSRDSMRHSTPPATSRRSPSREVVRRQSRIVWTAVGVGLALCAIAAYELVDRDAPSSNAGTPPSAVRTTVPPVPPALDPPAPAKLVSPRAPAEIASARAMPLVDAGRNATRTSIPAAAPPRNPWGPRAAPAPAPPPAPPPVVTAAPPPEPAPPPAEPPPPKPKEDPFGI